MEKLIGFVVGMLLFFSSLGVGNAGPPEADFTVLFDRCRKAIETASPLNTSGLVSAAIHEDHKRSWGVRTTQVGWAFPNSIFYIAFTTWTAKDDLTRRICQIYLDGENEQLSEVEQGRLLRQFLLRQTQLIGKGTHEIDRRLSPIPPIMNLGFLLALPNPKGCTVTNNIAVAPDGSFFSAGSGEQAIKACNTP